MFRDAREIWSASRSRLLPAMPPRSRCSPRTAASFMLTLAAHEGDLDLRLRRSRPRARRTWRSRPGCETSEGDGHDIRFLIMPHVLPVGQRPARCTCTSAASRSTTPAAARRARIARPAGHRPRALRARARPRRACSRCAWSTPPPPASHSSPTAASIPATWSSWSPRCPSAPCGSRRGWCASAPRSTAATASAARSPTILEADRHSIGLLAVLAEQAGSEDDRRPEILAAARARPPAGRRSGARRAPRY